MKLLKKFLATGGILALLAGVASAQTNYITVTNYVTVTVTNIVILTNAAPAPIAITAPVVIKPHKEVKYSWNQSVSAGLTLARGNTDTTLFSADYTATKKTPKNEYDIAAGLAYGEQDSQETIDNYRASFQWNHLYSDRFYDYVRTDGLRDYIADINYRFTIGPGMGYYLIKEKETTFSIEGGGNFEAQELGDSDSTFATVRLGDNFEHKINDHARFWQSFSIFPQVDRWDNYTADFEIGAEASIFKAFSLRTTLDDEYNNRPAAGRFKNDIRLVAGVGYKF